MTFDDIRGNDRLKERLIQTIRSRRIFHGYIFEGPDGDTDALAQAFVGAALCERKDGSICGTCAACRRIQNGNSENLLVLGGEGTIKDKEVESLISRTLMASYSDDRTFMIIKGAGSMTARAQNRLLKTLEEPPEGVTILLLTDNSEALVQTIRSRCQLVKLFSEGIDRAEESQEEFRRMALDTAAALVKGAPFCEMFPLMKELTESRQTAQTFVTIAETFFRDVIMYGYDPDGKLTINRDDRDLIKSCARRLTIGQLEYAVNAAERATEDLHRNVSPGYAVKYMILDIQEKLSEKVS